MSTPRSQPKPEGAGEKPQTESPADEDPGTNAVQHEPDPQAEALPEGDRKYHPRSPYTTGNY
jgi:hypothetical protein